MVPPVRTVLNFLVVLFNQGLSYSALNTARSALSTFIMLDNTPAGSHHLIVRFMKGVFNKRPYLPKNTVTWDVSIVLRYFTTLPFNKYLSRKILTLKLSVLLALLSGQRLQTLKALDINNLQITSDKVSFQIGEKLKQTRPNFHLGGFELASYKDEKLCIVHLMREYLRRTKSSRTSPQLLLCYVKPFGAASRSTIARWFKTMLNKAGVNMQAFTPHSVRSASTSKAFAANVPLETLLKQAGWSNAKTFAKFYHKPIKDSTAFSKAILKA